MDLLKILTRWPLDTTLEYSKFVYTNLSAVSNYYYNIYNK